jgi:beta-mannosidase
MGIWKNVDLAFRCANEIDNIYVFTQDINPYSAQIKLEVAFKDFEDRGDSVHIEIVSPDGQTVFEKDRVIIKDSLYEYIDIRDAKLWYPVGYGEQPLYAVKVSTSASSKEEKIGIRKVTVLQLEDEEESDYKNFSLELKKEEYLQKYDFNEKSAGFIVLVNGIKIM